MSFEKSLLVNVENPYYFGIGGLGDFLLLMSTFYDDVDDHTDVIFVCNNMTPIREMSKMFPKIDRWWFYPRKQFSPSIGMWNAIASRPNCLGTGVTPKNFDYIGDWIECGKTNVFDYYGVKRNPAWAAPIATDLPFTVIQPFGGADDPTKLKEIPRDKLEELCLSDVAFGVGVYFLIGSKRDAEVVGEINGVKWITEIDACFSYIRKCKNFIGADSWGKTLAAFAGKHVTVYPNIYTQDLTKMFGHEKDPGNYVFLDNWGFEFYAK